LDRSPSQRCEILVFDENRERADIIHSLISRSRRSTNVCIASTLGEAFELIRNQDPATDFDIAFLVLADLTPEALELVREMKSSARLQRTVLVVFTGSQPRLAELYDLRVNAAIITPETPAELVDAIEASCQFWLEVAQLPVDRPWVS
jgi:CheY-like chemotaxis protein